MVQGQVQHQCLYLTIVLTSFKEVLVKFLACKINIWYKFGFLIELLGHEYWFLLSFVAPVSFWAGTEHTKVHNVAGQGASLVGEDVLYLPKLFVQVWTLHLGGQIFLLIIDTYVPCDERGLTEFNHFQTDKQWDGHHVCEKQDPGSEGLQPDLYGKPGGPISDLALRHQLQVVSCDFEFCIPKSYIASSTCTANTHGKKDKEDLFPSLCFQIRLLLLWPDWIPHDSCVVADVSYQTDYKLCVF